MDYKSYDNVSKSIDNVKENCIYFCFSEDVDVVVDIYENVKVSHFVGRFELDLDNYSMSTDISGDFVNASKVVYGFDKTNMDYVAITGTNGKTSVAIIVNKLLNRLDKASYLGTAGLFINEKSVGYNGLTTPFADMLYESIQKVDKCSNYFVMEVSSHALSQKRIEGLKYKVCAFTNLSKDHLDFHKDMDDYYDQKKKILEYMDEDSILIINNDDDYSKNLKFSNVVSVGSENSDFVIENIKENSRSTIIDFSYDNRDFSVEIDLIAKFNVYNYLMSVAIVVNLGYNINDVIEKSYDLSVSGRMEVLKISKSPTVILDFAHSPDSIKKVLEFAKSQDPSRIITLTGSAGQRDAMKRPLMGYICGEYSDEVIFTEDDPRCENVMDIINDLSKDVVDSEKITKFENRIDALNYAIKERSEDDIIVLLGKSGQTLMYYDGYTKEYDEIKLARLILEECYGKQS